MENLKNLLAIMFLSFIAFVASLTIVSWVSPNNPNVLKFKFKNEKVENLILEKAVEAEDYCKKNDYNQDFCILIDMSIHSGKNRFRVYDFNKNKVTHSYLVSHGCGENGWSWEGSKTNPTFSNVADSHLSSLGKYAIGDRGWSSWGVNVNYKLHGLEESNSNAYKRWIVFHSWDNIQDNEIYPYGTDEGWGCPAVSNESFKKIDKLLKNQSKSTLMWIYK
tara:strand:+ start:3210 stop:3869 length:660 start_codon:yes stop_codon:yes gene_type:complete